MERLSQRGLLTVMITAMAMSSLLVQFIGRILDMVAYI